MSYDVYVGCHSCGADLIRPHGHNNLTSNLAEMWNQAGAPLRDMGGMLASDAIPKLQRAIDNLKNYPEEYQRYTPSNGWGTYEQAVQFLESIRDACARDLEATLTVSH